MREVDVGEFLGDNICDYIAPELGDVEDIGFIDTAELSTTFTGNITCVATQYTDKKII